MSGSAVDEGASAHERLGDYSSAIEQSTGQRATGEPVPRWGRLTPVIVTAGLLVASVLSWWAIGDPRWGLFGSNQPAVSAVLFWSILAIVWTGFVFEGWPFKRLPQPLSGVVHVFFDLAVALGVVVLFTSVVGSWDPTFSPHASHGAGWTATAFIVLIGFYAYTLVAASWEHYPYEHRQQPESGVGQWFVGAFLTVVGVVVLVYPNFSPALERAAPLKLAPMTGWVYSSIVILIVAAMLWDNTPWASLGNRHARALGTLAGSLLLGLLLYWGLRVFLGALIPADIRHMRGFSLDSETAQFGVCVNFWALAWGLVFGSPPSRLGAFANRAVRTAIVLALSVLTYIVFMRFFATTVLHFPPLKGHYGGNPLTWMDWAVLVLLFYTSALDSYGSHRRVRPPRPTRAPVPIR